MNQNYDEYAELEASLEDLDSFYKDILIELIILQPQLKSA